LLDNRAPETVSRFASLSRIWDPWTIPHLQACGVKEGWRCLEVGAGGGSIARWLSERVGPGGWVLATDIDPRHLEGLSGPNLSVRRHDITTEALPEADFDLVHSRLVLQHIRPRARALRKLVRSLRPGGWILVEDFAHPFWLDPVGDPESVRLFRRGIAAMSRLIRKRGGDPHFGRKLVARLVSEGIRPIRAEAFAQLWRAGSPGADLLAANFRQIRDEALEDGLLTEAELDRLLELLQDPEIVRYSPLMISAWGPKPG
jgi:SAM-dependent methyltransferase